MASTVGKKSINTKNKQTNKQKKQPNKLTVV